MFLCENSIHCIEFSNNIHNELDALHRVLFQLLENSMPCVEFSPNITRTRFIENLFHFIEFSCYYKNHVLNNYIKDESFWNLLESFF